MNSEKSKTSHPHRLLHRFTNKMDLLRGEKSVALSNLNINYAWKKIKSSYKTINLKYLLQDLMINSN